MKKLLFAALVAVFAVVAVSDVSARCGKKTVHRACGPKPICKKMIQQEVCAPAIEERFEVVQYKCPEGYSEDSAAE